MFWKVAYPGKWYDEGPFGIWKHPDGHEIVGIEPGYVLTTANGGEQEFNDLYEAMLSIKE